MDIASCGALEVDRRFRGAYCVNRPDDRGSTRSETSVYFNESTRRCIPEGYLHCRRRDNLKFHREFFIWFTDCQLSVMTVVFWCLDAV
jgi:hypothetical protein